MLYIKPLNLFMLTLFNSRIEMLILRIEAKCNAGYLLCNSCQAKAFEISIFEKILQSEIKYVTPY